MINNIYQSKYFTKTDIAPGHNNCTTAMPYSENSFEYNPTTGKSEWVAYSGMIFLTNQNQTYLTSTTTQLVEGSCREERVLVHLCPTCQIP